MAKVKLVKEKQFSASPVSMATGLINGKWQILITVDYVDDPVAMPNLEQIRPP